LCQLTFAAVGCATAAHLSAAGVPFPLAVVGAGLAAVPLGFVISIPATRLPVVYLAIATFGFGILVENLLFSTGVLFGGTGSLQSPRPGWATSDNTYFFVLAAVAAASCLAIVAIRRGRLGRLLRGLADAPAAIEANGASPVVVRTIVFCASAFLAGVGGAVIGPVTGTASGGIFDFGASLSIVAVLYIAGPRPLIAPAIAAALYLIGPSYLTNPTVVNFVPIAFGVAAILAATGFPEATARWLAGTPRLSTRVTSTGPALERANATRVAA
jgi:ABC-type branched-subunit amino acid transport system permease subunit